MNATVAMPIALSVGSCSVGLLNSSNNKKIFLKRNKFLDNKLGLSFFKPLELTQCAKS